MSPKCSTSQPSGLRALNGDRESLRRAIAALPAAAWLLKTKIPRCLGLLSLKPATLSDPGFMERRTRKKSNASSRCSYGYAAACTFVRTNPTWLSRHVSLISLGGRSDCACVRRRASENIKMNFRATQSGTRFQYQFAKRLPRLQDRRFGRRLPSQGLANAGQASAMSASRRGYSESGACS